MKVKILPYLIIGLWGILGFFPQVSYGFGEQIQVAIDPPQQNAFIFNQFNQVQQVLENPASLSGLIASSNIWIGPQKTKRLFFQLTRNQLKQLSRQVEKLVEWTHFNGYEAYFYLGQPEYALEHGEPNLIWDQLLTYQKNHAASQKFDGVYLDIRPYELGDWKKQSSYIMKRYYSLLKTLKIQKIFSNESFKTILTIHPHWIFQNADTTDPYIYELLNFADSLAYDTQHMEFEDLKQSLNQTLNYLQELNTPLMLLIQPDQLKLMSHLPVQQYYRAQKNQLIQAFGQNPSFKTFAYFDPHEILKWNRESLSIKWTPASVLQRSHPIDGYFDDWEFSNPDLAIQSTTSSANTVQADVHHNQQYLYFYFEIEKPSANAELDIDFWIAPASFSPWVMKRSVFHFLIESKPLNNQISLKSLNRWQQPIDLEDSVIRQQSSAQKTKIELAIPKKHFFNTANPSEFDHFLFSYQINQNTGSQIKSLDPISEFLPQFSRQMILK